MHIGASGSQSATLANDLVDCCWDDPLECDFKLTNNRVNTAIDDNALNPGPAIIAPVDNSKESVVLSPPEYHSAIEKLHETTQRTGQRSVINSCMSDELHSISQSDEDEPGIPYKRMVEIASEMARKGEIPGLLDFQSTDDRQIVKIDGLNWPKNNARSTFSQMANSLHNTAQTCSNDVALPKRVFVLETPTSAHTNKLVVYNKDDSLLQTLKANNNEVGNSINENTTSLRNASIEHFNSFNDKAIPSCLEHKSTVEGLHGNTPMHFGASKTRFPALAYKLVDCTWDDPLSEDFKANNKAESSIVENPFNSKNMNIDLVHPRNNLVPRLQDYQSNDKKSRVDATVPNCASEMPSSAHTNNPVDYSWYDTLHKHLKQMSRVQKT
ncbi:hypothetical protein EB796_014724 [Bugula neritina]|uniref:Uncharacterized protein n=1 Tax=Bugula neritina TaxID=10212 RepID=A0A7J7JMV6_BUGNE|nr:hypothetical protein EB796_014724 [Bugula neritina]